MAKKILFVAMQMSIHTARWINQIKDAGWEIHLFPVNYLPPHPDLAGLTIHQPFIPVRPKFILKQIMKNPRLLWQGLTKIESLSYGGRVTIKAIYPIPMFVRMFRYLNALKKTVLGESGMTIPTMYGPRTLNRLIRKLKPDLIHSLEFQHCGYNVLSAKALYGKGFPLWMATNWGSDIYYFQQFENHRTQISRLLAQVDFYSCECDRDVALAKALGLKGQVMQVAPNTGGFNLNLVKQRREVHLPSTRKVIMVKGYQHFVGRALTALDAIEACHEDLKGYVIIVFSASPEVYERVADLHKYFALNISVLNHTTHFDMLKMFSRARIYLGVSLSDAISTSLLEALALGAFPIQTNTSCCSEWIEDGKSGFEIPADDINVIINRLRRALVEDELVDKAAALNWQTVCERLDEDKLQQKTKHIYETIFHNKSESVQPTSSPSQHSMKEVQDV